MHLQAKKIHNKMHHMIHTPIVAIIYFLEHESYKVINGEKLFL